MENKDSDFHTTYIALLLMQAMFNLVWKHHALPSMSTNLELPTYQDVPQMQNRAAYWYAPSTFARGPSTLLCCECNSMYSSDVTHVVKVQAWSMCHSAAVVVSWGHPLCGISLCNFSFYGLVTASSANFMVPAVCRECLLAEGRHLFFINCDPEN